MCGAHPNILHRLVETNLEVTVGYGEDPYTIEAKEKILKACNLNQGEVHLLVGGTQTNIVVIDALLRRHEGVLAAESAHINVHESGAIEATGHKILVLPSYDGKIVAQDIEHYVYDFYRNNTYEHMVAPGMLYISHPTELGTLYTLDELTQISAACQAAHLPLYIDGARIAYGLAAYDTDITLADLASLADIFYIGGTKIGTLCGEAIVTRHTDLLPHFRPLIKQHGALLAKGRLLGVQFATLFDGDLYLRIGRHAIDLAMKLRQALTDRGYSAFVDSPTNQQFFVLPNEEIDRLSPYVGFELWGPRGEKETPVRFVTSWFTTSDDIEQFIALLSSPVSSHYSLSSPDPR